MPEDLKISADEMRSPSERLHSEYQLSRKAFDFTFQQTLPYLMFLIVFLNTS
jgi:hypothetical protein